MGLRQMMFMSGLKSFEFFTGMLFADSIVFAIPNLVFTVIMPFFSQIMSTDQIGWFVLSWLLFDLAYLCIVYTMSHIFDGPATGTKAMSAIMFFLLLVLPILIACLIGGF